MSALTKFQPKLTPGHLRLHVNDEAVIDGYIKCDGSYVSTSLYPKLADAIGYKETNPLMNGVLQTSQTTQNINDVAYNDGKFVYVANNATIGFSNNSIANSWTSFTNITYVGGKTVARDNAASSNTFSLTDLTGGVSTAPEEGDVVFIAVSTASTSNTTSNSVSGYIQIAALYSNDTFDTNLWVGYKVMSSTPDTTVTVPAGASANDSQTVAVQVWRNIDSNIFDVTRTTANTNNTVLVNPPSITTISNNTLLLVIGAGAHDTGATRTYTASYLSNFLTLSANNVNDSIIGFGSIQRPTIGAYDPAQWTFSTTDSTNYSNASVTIALKPIANTSSNNYRSVIYANSTYVLVGDGGALGTSSTGKSWTGRTSGTLENINDVAYGNGKFVYVANNGVTGTSNDAVTWTAQEPQTNTLTYVGGKTFTSAGDFYYSTPSTISLTDLTGGVASAPAADDIVFIAVGSGSVTQAPQPVGGYTQIAELYANDTYDTNLWIGYRKMGATPDSNVIVRKSALQEDAQTVAIQVWRNIDLNTYSIKAETVTGTNGLLVDPPAVTTTANTLLLIAGASGHIDGNNKTYTASYLSNFLTAGMDDTHDSSIGFGSIFRTTAGTYDPAAWTFSGNTTTSYSYAAATISISKRNNSMIAYGDNKYVSIADDGKLSISSDAITWNVQPDLTYVGGKVFGRAGTISTTALLSLTDLTGGTNSSPSEGDVVFLAIATGSNSDRTFSVSGYTQITELYANDVNDTNLWIGYKVMGVTPDTSVTIPVSGSTTDAQTVAIQVWRNVHADIFDATTTTVVSTAGTSSVDPNPPIITTVSNNSVILVVGAAAHGLGNVSFGSGTAPYDNFITIGADDTIDSTIGFGSMSLVFPTTIDPRQFFLPLTGTADDSVAAATIALKPKYSKLANHVTYSNNTFVLVGKGGNLETSTNGTDWTTRTSGTSSNLNDVTYSDLNNLYMYSGASGLLATSPDTITWTSRTSGTSNTINALTYGNGVFLYGGNSGTLGTSSLYTYDISVQFILPTTNTNVFVETTTAIFNPKAYIKYE